MGKKQDAYEYKVKTGATWAETEQQFGVTRKEVRGYYEGEGLPPPSKAKPRITGGMDEEPQPDRAELWQRAVGIQQRRAQSEAVKARRRVTFDEGPVAVFFMGDLHLGGSGVDYLGLDADIRLIQHLADNGVQVAVQLMGDLLDNFVIGKLKNLRLHTSPFLAVEEWGLVDYALERLAPYIIGAVAGNHDNWSWALVGVDLLRDRHRQLTPGILYDPLELDYTLQVGEYACRVIARHAWKGNSKFNPTHGLDDKHLTRGREADIYVAAHTHRGALYREIDNGGQVGHAVLVGSYKEDDKHAKKIGFAPPLPGCMVAVVVDEDGVQFGTSNVDALPRLLT